LASQVELQDARLQRDQALSTRARALRDVQVARARLALLRDLPLSSSGGGAAGASGAPANVGTMQPAGAAAGTATAGTPAGTLPVAAGGVPGVAGAPGGPP
jgi:outer membrane protein TolC